MTCTGRVINGVVIPDGHIALPEGAEVRIDVLDSVDERTTSNSEDGPVLFDRLQPVIGILSGLPSDLAANHDHYLHGRPKP